MAIIWVDPYLDSANGGIHGTTGSGSGTYAAPYSWYDMNGNNALGAATINAGDEIRIKGLTDTQFWSQIGKPFSSVQQEGGEDVRWNVSGDQNTFLRVTSLYDNENQLYTYTNYDAFILGIRATTTWWAAFPKLKESAGYDVFNSAYRITNPNGKNTSAACFRQSLAAYTHDVSNPAKITAGWTSETAQNGITYIIYPINTVMRVGDTGSNNYFQIDCLNTLVLGNGSNANSEVGAIDLQVKAIICSNYNAGYYSYITAGQGNTTNNDIDWTTTAVKPGRIVMGQAMNGGYHNIATYCIKSAGNTSYSPPVQIDTFTRGYYYCKVTVFLTQTKTNDTSIPDLRFRKYFAEYHLYVESGGGNTADAKLTLLNDYEYSVKQNVPIEFNNINIVTETIGTPDTTNVPQYSSSIYNYPGQISITYLPSYSTRRALDSTSNISVYSNSSSILKSRVLSNNNFAGVWFNQWYIENAGETIDTVTSAPATCNAIGSSSTWDSSGVKIFVAYESTSNNAVNLIPRNYKAGDSSSTAVAVEYKSPTAFPGKTCWRLFGAANGYSYSQMYRIPVPNFASASSDYTFSTYFNTTSSPGVSVSITLYAYSLSNKVTAIKTFTPTVNGNTITFEDTVSPALLKSYLVSQLFVEVTMTKTSTANCSVAFNSFDLS